MQSLKLKFKKEENPKCKDDQELNEIGKSIVHVTNEELNSSEMVFFCIPKVDSSLKNLPKKKLNTKDTKENHTQKEIEIINQINSETYSLNKFNSVVLEKNNVITTDDSIDINNSNSISKEINFTPTVAIDNVQELDCNLKPSEVLNKIEVVLNNQSLSIKKNSENCNLTSHMDKNNSDKSIEAIKTEFIHDFSENDNPTSNIHNNGSDESNICPIKTEFIHDFSETSYVHKKSSDESDVHSIKIKLTHDLCEDNYITSNMHKNSSDEVNEQAIKTEVIHDLSECNHTNSNMPKNSADELNLCAVKTEFIYNSDTIKNEKECNFQSVSTELITDENVSVIETNELLLNENIMIKSEAVENLPKCHADVSKRNNNESEKQQINKWTIDEDKIILQTCKRVEDIEVLLETINRRIPRRSVSEVKFVFSYIIKYDQNYIFI